MYCPNCGYENISSVSYCENCGYDLNSFEASYSASDDVQLRTCEYCGMLNPVDVQFCRNCDHDVSEVHPTRINYNSNNYNQGVSYNNNNTQSNGSSGFGKWCTVCCFLVFLIWIISIL